LADSDILEVVLGVSSEDAAAAPPPLTPRQVAERLTVSESTVRRWLVTGELEGERLGGRYRITEAALRTMRRSAAQIDE
jgi:excisionase family DNA binding protein